MESYSTAISTLVWNGNHDGSGLSSNSNNVVRYTIGHYMERVHKEVYEPEGKWHYGDQPVKPSGIKTLTVNGQTDIWPSWFNAEKNSGVSKETLTFNRYNHTLASDCTPESYKIEIEVTKIIDPVTGKAEYTVPEPYDAETSDTCTYIPPEVSIATSGDKIIATIKKGSEKISGYTLTVDGTDYNSINVSADGTINGYTLTGEESSLKFTISDAAGYTATSSLTLNPTTKKSSTASSSSSATSTKTNN